MELPFLKGKAESSRKGRIFFGPVFDFSIGLLVLGFTEYGLDIVEMFCYSYLVG